MKISTYSLDYKGKEIFLDAVCLLSGMDERILHPFWKASGFSAAYKKCLIKIGDDSKLWMPRQLRDLGREIVLEETYEQPGKKSRQWCGRQVLERGKGIDKVQAIHLDCDPQLEGKRYSGGNIKKLENIMVLGLGNANLDNGFERCLLELNGLTGHRYIGSALNIPSDLDLESLVVLNLSGSMVGESWIGWSLIQEAKKLEVVNLKSCHQLRTTPDFTAFPPIKTLILEDCRDEAVLDPSIAQLKTLEYLNLKNCWSLRKLPDELGSLVSLSELVVDGSPIKEIPHAEICQILKLLVPDTADHCL